MYALNAPSPPPTPAAAAATRAYLMPPQLLLLALLLIFFLRKLTTDSRTTSNQCYRIFVSVLLLSLLAALTIKSLLQNPFHAHSNNAAGVVSRNCQHSSMQRACIYGSNQFATKTGRQCNAANPQAKLELHKTIFWSPSTTVVVFFFFYRFVCLMHLS
jgi:hypothetical protein